MGVRLRGAFSDRMTFQCSGGLRPTRKEVVWSRKSFENGTWGGEIRREFEPQSGDIVALERMIVISSFQQPNPTFAVRVCSSPQSAIAGRQVVWYQ